MNEMASIAAKRAQDLIVGCVALVPEGHGVFELSKMAVAPAAQGHGLGHADHGDAGKALIDHPLHRIGDLRVIPQRAVLVGEQDHVTALAQARRTARVQQHHHGQQPMRLGLVGHQLGERAAERDRLGGQILGGRGRGRGR